MCLSIGRSYLLPADGNSQLMVNGLFFRLGYVKSPEDLLIRVQNGIKSITLRMAFVKTNCQFLLALEKKSYIEGSHDSGHQQTTVIIRLSIHMPAAMNLLSCRNIYAVLYP